MTNRFRETVFLQRVGLPVACGIILAAVFLVYSNSINGKFFIDDYRNIVSNPHIKIIDLSFSSLLDAAWKSPCRWRWLPNITLALNYYFGGFSTTGYHIFNIAIHAGCAITLFLLFYQTLTSPILNKRRDKAIFLSLVATLLWAVHPLQTNAVTYVVQRMTSMAALFSLLALLLYIQGHKDKRRRPLWWTGGIIAALAAFLSKENSAMLPLLVLAYDRFFLRRDDELRSRSTVLLLCGGGLLLFALGWIASGHNPLTGILSGYRGREFTLTTRLLTECRVIFHYLSLIIMPLPSRLNLAYDYPLSLSLVKPLSTLFAATGVVSLAVLPIILFNRSRLLSFAIFWFLANMVIESSFIPLEIIFEHRTYLPSMFIFLAMVVFMDLAVTDRRIFLSVSLVLVIALAASTLQRNTLWNNEFSFWRDVVAKSPNLSRAHIGLGLAYEDAKDHQAAIKEFTRAIKLKRENGAAWLNLGYIYEQIKAFDQAEQAYKTALWLPLVPRNKVYAGLARTMSKQRRYRESLSWGEKALKANPLYPEAWSVTGIAFDYLGRFDLAERHLRRALALNPMYTVGYCQLAYFYLRHKLFSKSLKIAKQGLALPSTGGNRKQLLKLKNTATKGLMEERKIP